jgi:putative transposase
MIASDVKNIKELEDENGRLNRIYADVSLQNEGLNNVIKKNL